MRFRFGVGPRRVEPRLRGAGRDHLCAKSCKALRDSKTDAAGSAGYEHRLPAKRSGRKAERIVIHCVEVLFQGVAASASRSS